MSFAPAFARRVVFAALMLGSQPAAFAQTPESSRPADRAQTRETRLLREDYESLRDVMVVSLEMVRNASELAKVDRHLVGAALTNSITQQLRAIGVQVVEPIAGTLDALNVPTLRVGISTKANGTHVVYLVSVELSRLVMLSDLERPPASCECQAAPLARPTQRTFGRRFDSAQSRRYELISVWYAMPVSSASCLK